MKIKWNFCEDTIWYRNTNDLKFQYLIMYLKYKLIFNK